MLAQGKRCPSCLERTSDVQPLLDASMPEAAVSTSCSGRSIGRGHGNGDSDFYNDVVREGCSQENHATPKTDSKYKFPALYAKFPVWSKVAVISRGSWALGAPGSRPAPDSCRPAPPRQSARRVAARKAPASSTALMRRFVRSLLCWNLSALSWRTLNSVAGCFSTSSGAPCAVSWGRAL